MCVHQPLVSSITCDSSGFCSCSPQPFARARSESSGSDSTRDDEIIHFDWTPGKQLGQSAVEAAMTDEGFVVVTPPRRC